MGLQHLSVVRRPVNMDVRAGEGSSACMFACGLLDV